jgi:hypothetical protein
VRETRERTFEDGPALADDVDQESGDTKCRCYRWRKYSERRQ